MMMGAVTGRFVRTRAEVNAAFEIPAVQAASLRCDRAHAGGGIAPSWFRKTTLGRTMRLGLALFVMTATRLALPAASSPATPPQQPVDWRCRLSTGEFRKSGEGEWTSRRVRAPFPFEELIYSWHSERPGDSFRLYLKARFSRKDETDWLDAGYWGDVAHGVTNRQPPTFDRGVLDMDWLKLKTPATAFQFKVVSAGQEPLRAPPALTVIVTDNHPPAKVARRWGARGKQAAAPARVLDVPLRRQFDSQGRRMRDRCQSAALASAMEYYGKSVPLEQITALTYDPEYAYPGIWPRVIAAAREFGFDGYLGRFRDWPRVRQALAENKILLCSIRLRAGQCQAPPYASMGNHIVALCGVTDDGRVVVTDSALGRSGTGYLCQWLQRDFEKVWMETKGGVAMVICPPAGAVVRQVGNLPPFPSDRAFPLGDDH